MELVQLGWILVGVGFVPWRVSRRRVSQRRGKRVQRWSLLQVEAAFWRLNIEHSPQGVTWRLSLPLVTRLKAAVWSALFDNVTL